MARKSGEDRKKEKSGEDRKKEDLALLDAAIKRLQESPEVSNNPKGDMERLVQGKRGVVQAADYDDVDEDDRKDFQLSLAEKIAKAPVIGKLKELDAEFTEKMGKVLGKQREEAESLEAKAALEKKLNKDKTPSQDKAAQSKAPEAPEVVRTVSAKQEVSTGPLVVPEAPGVPEGYAETKREMEIDEAKAAELKDLEREAADFKAAEATAAEYRAAESKRRETKAAEGSEMFIDSNKAEIKNLQGIMSEYKPGTGLARRLGIGSGPAKDSLAKEVNAFLKTLKPEDYDSEDVKRKLEGFLKREYELTVIKIGGPGKLANCLIKALNQVSPGDFVSPYPNTVPKQAPASTAPKEGSSKEVSVSESRSSLKVSDTLGALASQKIDVDELLRKEREEADLRNQPITGALAARQQEARDSRASKPVTAGQVAVDLASKLFAVKKPSNNDEQALLSKIRKSLEGQNDAAVTNKLDKPTLIKELEGFLKEDFEIRQKAAGGQPGDISKQLQKALVKLDPEQTFNNPYAPKALDLEKTAPKQTRQ